MTTIAHEISSGFKPPRRRLHCPPLSPSPGGLGYIPPSPSLPSRRGSCRAASLRMLAGQPACWDEEISCPDSDGTHLCVPGELDTSPEAYSPPAPGSMRRNFFSSPLPSAAVQGMCAVNHDARLILMQLTPDALRLLESELERNDPRRTGTVTAAVLTDSFSRARIPVTAVDKGATSVVHAHPISLSVSVSFSVSVCNVRWQPKIAPWQATHGGVAAAQQGYGPDKGHGLFCRKPHQGVRARQSKPKSLVGRATPRNACYARQ